MEVLPFKLIICLLLSSAFIWLTVSSTTSFCYDPVFVYSNTEVEVKCTTRSAYSSAECKFYYYKGSTYNNPVGIVGTDKRRQSDGSYQVNCTYTLNVQQLENGTKYYLYAIVNPDVLTVNVTTSVYFETAVITDFTVNDGTSSAVVDEGDSVTFSCEATGHPGATMRLTDGVAVDTITSKVLNVFQSEKIMQCYDRSTAIYTCEASNGRSSDEKSIAVYVRCALRLQDKSDYNKTYDGFLDSVTKSISVKVVGYPGPNQYELTMKNKTIVNETAWVVVPEDQYEIESYKPLLEDISVYAVEIKFLDDKTIQATQYVLFMGNGISPVLEFPFLLDESFTDDFPVVAVAVGVTVAVVLILVIVGVVVYCVYYRSDEA